MFSPEAFKTRLVAVLILAVWGLLSLQVSLAAQPTTPETTSSQAPEEQGSGTVLLSSYMCDGIESVVWGGVPDGSCVGTTGTFAFYPLDSGGEAITLQLDQSGLGSVLLPVGTYEVRGMTAGGSSAGFTIQVFAGESMVLTVLHPSGVPVPDPETPVPEPIAVETGFVEVTNYYCPGVEYVTLDPNVISPDCYTGAGTFAFYLFGDGSDEYWSLSLGADGYGSLELIAGSYAMVEQVTYTEHYLDVPVGETVYLTIVHPGSPATSLPPQDGTVALTSYECPQLVDASFNTSGISTECSGAEATFRFISVDSGVGKEQVLTTSADGIGTIELPAGNYEVIEAETLVSTIVTVEPGVSTSLTYARPAAPVSPVGEVIVVVVSCSTAEPLLPDSPVGGRGKFFNIADCVPTSTSLTISRTDAGPDQTPIRMYVNSSASLELNPGSYDVIDEETGAKYQFQILADQQSLLVVSQSDVDEPSEPQKGRLVERRTPD